jgi:hypothetical protein
MERCDGERAGYHLKCNGTLYRCECGNVGCMQNKEDACSRQGFLASGRCLKCAATGKHEMLTAGATHSPTLMGDPA